MIVCSCTVITDLDIENALVEILNAPDAPIPTPGIVFRHLSKRMNCCGCAPLAVDTIYNKVDELEKKGLISPTLSATTRSKLLAFTARRAKASPVAHIDPVDFVVSDSKDLVRKIA
ncbi:hypothetical protein APY04_1643 [Hyphomicrobium sulfonivorans]|uniref:BFD-like [2Fe-2S]-binding domain-containing protein n=1 Tax=Hyphomicrobium sulfonivorans TaxID=121290 RepID=A0A109BJM0_HYPSL|nr:hypothetical protein [Hyphomicrobium sulfonivorans]KWT69212.1 hypothetical protein APY04_1643 [Hyphomicrobium sulfonivorans]NSL71729.1 hypothetical protein [Hyphomicrobium sulfonivorans]